MTASPIACARQHDFEDVAMGVELPRIARGPITTAHLMRWSAARETFHKIHYDHPFTVEHERLPGLMVNGALKQNFLITMLKDWAGLEGWVWKMRTQLRAMDIVGTRLTPWGRVTGLHRAAGFGVVELVIGLVNGEGRESAPGAAVVALPYRGGPPIPYPFVPPVGLPLAYDQDRKA